jgi:hypothetical protein
LIDEQGDLREDQEVLDPSEIAGVLRPFGLLVERRVEPRCPEAIVLADHEADRNKTRPAARTDRRKRCPPGLGQE